MRPDQPKKISAIGREANPSPNFSQHLKNYIRNFFFFLFYFNLLLVFSRPLAEGRQTSVLYAMESESQRVETYLIGLNLDDQNCGRTKIWTDKKMDTFVIPKNTFFKQILEVFIYMLHYMLYTCYIIRICIRVTYIRVTQVYTCYV